MTKNIFTTYLKCLGVPHTNKYSYAIFENTPFRNTMYGISLALKKYNINNQCIRFKDKSQISDKYCPGIIVFYGNFVVLRDVSDETVTLMDSSNKKTILDKAKFLDEWDGLLLIAKVSDASVEPNLGNNRKTICLDYIKIIVLLFSIIVIFVSLKFLYVPSLSWSWWFVLFVNSLGIFVSWVLTQNQINKNNKIGNQLCSLIKDNGCEKVENSKGSRILNTFKLSDCAGSFFLTVFVLLFTQDYIYAVYPLLLIALPFTLWSIWYQFCRIKTLCFLCLCVTAIVWILFFIFSFEIGAQKLFISYIATLRVSLNLIFPMALFFVVLIVINWLIPIYKGYLNNHVCEYNLHNIILDENIVKTLWLSKKPFNFVRGDISTIYFGNEQSNRKLLVISNPLCKPCSKMHIKLNEIINYDISIQYLFVSFSREYDILNRYFIASYLRFGAIATWELMSNWYKNEEIQKVEFFHDMGLDPFSPEVGIEYRRQYEWLKNNPILGTPTLFLNGREITDPYSVDDIFYLPPI